MVPGELIVRLSATRPGKTHVAWDAPICLLTAHPPPMTLLLTVTALLAFAGNSVLCRLALGTASIDPVSFTSIRLGTGALTLAVILAIRDRALPQTGQRWASAFALFAYAWPFAFAYQALDTGVGALVLFAAVQITMLLAAVRSGERIGAAQWTGFACAALGLLALLLPGTSSPPVFESSLMFLAGAAWGTYSVLGRSSADALRNSSGNFLRASLLSMAVSLAWSGNVSTSSSGIGFAVYRVGPGWS